MKTRNQKLSLRQSIIALAYCLQKIDSQILRGYRHLLDEGKIKSVYLPPVWVGCQRKNVCDGCQKTQQRVRKVLDFVKRNFFKEEEGLTEKTLFSLRGSFEMVLAPTSYMKLHDVSLGEAQALFELDKDHIRAVASELLKLYLEHRTKYGDPILGCSEIGFGLVLSHETDDISVSQL